ncbi:MAG: tetratricopeptide repeat protein [Treponema sp.]|nr:tetratricopeptide repeat protein [Spirochaetales bacterium]MDY6191335.1 tetratricopeptide repeat protein [Treponema sp.]
MKKTFSILGLLFFSFILFAEKPIVRDIQAEAGKGNKINIFWTLPENPEKEISSFFIYRDTRQIASYAQIKNISPIAQIDSNFSGYTDLVKDYNDYFYCVLAVTKDSSVPYDLILLSFNSTVKGVHISMNTQQKEPQKKEQEKLYYEGTLRETPLPFIDIVENSLQPEPTVSEEAAFAAQTLTNKNKKRDPVLKPYIFEEDLISPDGGDDYLLFEILKQYFVHKNYDEAIVQLNKLAGTNIKDSTRSRVYFYIGECEYLTGEYEKAVKSFVKVQDIYPTLARKWINSSLDRI